MTAKAGLKPFPGEDWSAPLRKYSLGELKYLPADWREKQRIKIKAPDAKNLKCDCDSVIAAKKERPVRVHAISAQAQDITLGMFALLSARRPVKLDCPATSALLDAADIDLLPVLFYFKTEFNAARPSAYIPDLDPMFAKPHPNFPGHPSYPSGHAAQSRLFALVLGAAFPGLKSQLLGLADDIAFNREVAGVHFSSDSAAGKSLADQVFKLLMQQPAFTRLLPLVRAEWPENHDLR